VTWRASKVDLSEESVVERKKEREKRKMSYGHIWVVISDQAPRKIII
jgi:hypothetical protein